MAFIHMNFFSYSLSIQTAINIIIPQSVPTPDKKSQKESFPVLYLLHGLTDDYTTWQRQTSIERYALQKNIAVVMPSVNRSFYSDLPNGHQYFTYVSKELPDIIEQIFPVSSEREDRFVAGLSMGGYGAMKIAFSFPERYSAAASLSGALNISKYADYSTSFLPGELESILGNRAVKGSTDDLFYLAEKLAAGKNERPEIYQCCGTDDFLYEHNQDFLKHVRALGIKVRYEEGPGEHNWAYWDMMIQKVLDWLPIRSLQQ